MFLQDIPNLSTVLVSMLFVSIFADFYVNSGVSGWTERRFSSWKLFEDSVRIDQLKFDTRAGRHKGQLYLSYS